MSVSSAGDTSGAEPEVLTLPEISQRYPGRWVAMTVTERDGNLQPVKGRVVENDVDRYRLREKTAKYEEICIFYAGDSPYLLLL